MPAEFSGAARDCSVAEGSPIFHSISSPVKAYKVEIVVTLLSIEHSPKMILENVDFFSFKFGETFDSTQEIFDQHCKR